MTEGEFGKDGLLTATQCGSNAVEKAFDKVVNLDFYQTGSEAEESGNRN